MYGRGNAAAQQSVPVVLRSCSGCTAAPGGGATAGAGLAVGGWRDPGSGCYGSLDLRIYRIRAVADVPCASARRSDRRCLSTGQHGGVIDQVAHDVSLLPATAKSRPNFEVLERRLLVAAAWRGASRRYRSVPGSFRRPPAGGSGDGRMNAASPWTSSVGPIESSAFKSCCRRC